MALQWVILAYVVAAEALVAVILTLPSPKAIKSRIVSLIALILQPSLFIVPFAAFQLLDIYWKNEHRLMCTGEVCTASERDRYEKSIYKAQRNAVLCVGACLLYWCIFRICKYYREIQNMEELEKRLVGAVVIHRHNDHISQISCRKFGTGVSAKPGSGTGSDSNTGGSGTGRNRNRRTGKHAYMIMRKALIWAS